MNTIIWGNPIEGFQLLGLFKSGNEAEEFAETEVDENRVDWWIVELEKPRKEVKEGMKVLAVGDFERGFTFVGPFESEDEVFDLLGDYDDEPMQIIELMSKEEWMGIE